MLEVVVAQLDECRSLINRDSTTSLRMALLLADNVAEVIMAHKIENALAMNHIYEQYLRVVDQYPSASDYEEQVREARGKLVSKRARRDIDRNFGKKVDFLVQRNLIEQALGSGLHKLHEYRNEAYHQGRVRTGNLRQAVRIYFDVDCTLLEGFNKPAPLLSKLWPLQELAESMPTVLRYSEAEPHELPFAVVPSPEAVANSLSRTVQLDVDTLRHDLASYLNGQVDHIEKEISFCLDYGHFLFDGWKRADMLRMAYMIKGMESGGPALSLEEMRGRKYPTTLADLDRWRAEASRLRELRDRTSLLAEFARIEDELDPCLHALRELAFQVDRAYEDRMDLMRGK